jgi:hypothetical protein
VFLAVDGTNPGNFVGRGEDETLLEVLDGGAEGRGDIAGGVPKDVKGGMESGLAEVGWSEGVEGYSSAPSIHHEVSVASKIHQQ